MESVVTLAGTTLEIQTLSRTNKKQTIKKLSKNEILVLSTGEIKTVNESESRKDNIHSLRITLKKLRYLINNNFVGLDNEVFITLTYAENMTDTKRLYEDGKNFIKRLRYKYKDVSRVEYIAVVEPQARGAWHYHMLVKFPDVERIYISHEELESLWRHGFVSVQDITNVDNIGAYLSAYLANIDDIKGGRLYLYPAGMNIYRCSRGIKYPSRVADNVVVINEVLSDVPIRFSGSYSYDIDGYIVDVSYTQYNLLEMGLDKRKILGYNWDKLKKYLLRKKKIQQKEVDNREIFGIIQTKG